jgi:hypothetical protein
LPRARAPLSSRLGFAFIQGGVAYDRDGIRTRRIKILKTGISLMIASIVLTAPAMLLLKSHD